MTVEPRGGEASWPWPFSRADLTAGLRRLQGDTSLRVVGLQPLTIPYQRPAIGRVRGIRVEFEGRGGPGACSLVVKEPRGTTRAGLAGAGRREAGVYRALAGQLPLRMPALIAAAPMGDWLLLEAVRSARDPSRWRSGDYWTAVEGLAQLHDRFWGLSEDLSAFPWLGRPLEADFEVHVTAAAQAIQRIVEFGQPEALAGAPERMRVLARLTTQADEVIAPLRREPSTLLHGDYWPGNIAVLKDGSQVVYDWQMTSVGPAVIDLLVFVSKTAWWFGEPPVGRDEIVARYREALERRGGVRWDPAVWEELWDHALMWRFLQEWVDLLAASPDSLLAARTELLDRTWLSPVAAAVTRRLGEG